MSEFDVNGYNSHECDIHNHGYYFGAQSQQAKIDELQAKYDELNNRATGIALDQMTTAKLNYELQGRIDEAMDYIAESGGVSPTSEIALNDILKGNKDETII